MAAPEHMDYARSVVLRARTGELHPSEVIARLVRMTVETAHGEQPAFLVTPTAVPMEVYEPGLAITLLSEQNRAGHLRQVMPAENGGVRLMVRATADPRFGALAISNPNVPLQRMMLQGAGITDANVGQINRGAGGYVGDTLYAHPIILEYADEHPAAVIGGVDVFANDGTFRPMPEDIAGKGHYYSEVAQYARFHMPVTGLALGVLGARPIAELY